MYDYVLINNVEKTEKHAPSLADLYEMVCKTKPNRYFRGKKYRQPAEIITLHIERITIGEK